jgi:hypothetical protein
MYVKHEGNPMSTGFVIGWYHRKQSDLPAGCPKPGNPPEQSGCGGTDNETAAKITAGCAARRPGISQEFMPDEETIKDLWPEDADREE